MSGLSPVRRLRTKTSDISDFFRGSSHHTQRQSPSSIDLLQQTPQPPAHEQPSPPKTKRSRIPFLGRSKKKSLPPTDDSHGVLEATTLLSTAALPSVAGVSNERPDGLVFVIKQTEEPSTAASFKSPPIAPARKSNSSAHFTPAKHHHPRSDNLTTLTTSSSNADDLPNALVRSPPTPRTTSFDSTSTASQDRSSTPRPVHPTITVSISPPEDLEAFNNLFTRPRAPAPPPLTTSQYLNPRDSSDDDKLEPPEVDTPALTPPITPHPLTDTSSVSRISTAYTTDDGSASEFSSDQAERRLTMRILNSRIKPPKKKQISISVVKELERGLGTKIDFDSAEEIEDQVVSEPEPTPTRSPVEDPANAPWKRQTVATMPFKSSERPTSTRSCMKPSSASGRHVPGPPTMPLPPPPSPLATSTSPSVPNIPLPPSRKLSNASNRVTITRPRANTIPSVIPMSSSPTRSPSNKTRTKVVLPQQNKNPQNSDDPESLREALRLQRARFDDLAAYLLAISEKHALEKVVLMKKIDILEREARKTGRELKGLRYLVMNGTGSGVFNSTSTLPSSPGSRSTTPVHFQGSEDGLNHSLYPGTASSADNKNSKRGYHTPDSLSPNVSRPTSLTVPVADGNFAFFPDFPGLDALSNIDRRSSASSFSSIVTSAASSTSSLPLTNLMVPSTLSSALSAIPEARTPSPETRRDPEVAAAILAAERQREKEERRASRALRRLSSSSSASSTSAASSAYAANLKRGRPPSIAQVLGASSSMEDVLEKLRPFATPAKPSRN